MTLRIVARCWSTRRRKPVLGEPVLGEPVLVDLVAAGLRSGWERVGATDRRGVTT
jgi:hypothetical protein